MAQIVKPQTVVAGSVWCPTEADDSNQAFDPPYARNPYAISESTRSVWSSEKKCPPGNILKVKEAEVCSRHSRNSGSETTLSSEPPNTVIGQFKAFSAR